MQKLLWIGSHFFCRELQSCGWQDVVLHNFEDACVFGWDDLVSLAGFTPDVLVVADKSRPPFVLGVEDFPCLTVFYSVDAHVHSWQSYYAQTFDACLVSLRDSMQSFVSPHLPVERVHWSPPFAWNHDQPDPEAAKVRDCLFVGTVNKNTPKREVFLRELKHKLPGLHVASGGYRELYSQARVVLNQCGKGDLNFRVFEAMGCGASLVTPRVGHGQAELFTDGEHLLTYTPDDVGDALSKIEFLLNNQDVAARMGAAALDKINAEHRAGHRAQAFTDFIRELWAQDAAALVAARQAKAWHLREQYLRMPCLFWAEDMSDRSLKEAYLAASKGCFRQRR